MKKINFTKKAIEAIPLPEKGRVSIGDTKTPGLIITITAKGVRTFYLYRRIDGQPTRYMLGSYPSMTPENARHRTAKELGRIAEGINPAAERRVKKVTAAQVKTLRDAFNYYHDHYLLTEKSPKTAANDKLFFRQVGNLAGRRMDTITTEDIKRLHAKLGKNGKIQANRVIQLLRRLYNYCADELGFTGENPVVIKRVRRTGGKGGGITLYREQSRERYILPSEFPRFIKALQADESQDFQDLVGLLLFTGARRGNVQAMKWADLNLDGGLWTIPDTKNGRTVTLPLSEWALKILYRRFDARDDSEFVFPGRGRTGHIVEPKKHWTELLKRAEITGLTMHDLRRTLGSYQASGGSSLSVIARSLGHHDTKSTAIYSRIGIDPVLTSITNATGAMMLAAEGVEDE